MEDLYSATAEKPSAGEAEAENENARAPHWQDLANSAEAEAGIEQLLSLCADDAVTMLCMCTTYLCRKYPKAYPEEPTLLKKAVKRITPDRTSYFHVSPKIDVGRSSQFKDTSSPSTTRRRHEGGSLSPQKDRNKGFFHLDRAVNHSDLTEPKQSKKIGRPISYKRTQAKASVSNELQDWAQDRKIKDWLRERKKKEEGRRRMTDQRHVHNRKWLEESKERILDRQHRISIAE